MAYVQPTGRIELFRGIKLDNRYMHTLYFDGEQSQDSFFSGLSNKVVFTGQSYSRPNRETVRVRANAEDIQSVSYMRFRNYVKPDNNYPHETSKWYYAFVLAINYVNENTTDVVYEIDVMQTWFIQNGTLLPCYIERQHVTNDTFPDNLEPEPVGSDVFDLDELFVDEQRTDPVTGVQTNQLDYDFDGFSYVISSTDEPDTSSMIKDGIVCGTSWTHMPAVDGNMSNLKTWMDNSLGSWDKNEQKTDVVDFFMFPKSFVEYDTTNERTYTIHHPHRYDNYVPKNKKLYGYPFAYLYVTTCDGDAGIYRWEYFDGDVTTGNQGVQFELNASVLGGGSIELHPRVYNGVDNNYDAKVVMTNFPKCSYNYDAYQAFVASGGQTKLNYEGQIVQEKGHIARNLAGLQAISSIASSTVGIIGNASMGNAVGVAKNAVNLAVGGAQGSFNMANTEIAIDEAEHKIGFEFKDAMYQPNIVIGSQVPNIAVGKGYLKYRFFHAHVRDSEVKRIDDFLTVYGYSINKVETPNLNGRQYWNFIKTHNAEISGSMPASSRSAIARIFDGGIFFWKSHSKLGNFMTNNNVVNPIVS